MALAEVVAVDPVRPQRAIVARAAELIRQGGVLGYPTETAYGLGADALNAKARERIFAIKGRERSKALPVIVSDLEQLASLSDPIPASAHVLAERFWPGPLTLVLPLRPELRAAFDGGESVAVRVSGLALARELASASGCCLVATSANLSGGEPARSARDVLETLGEKLDLILDGGVTPTLEPSTIVDIRGSEPRLLREGPVGFDEVLQALRGGSAP